MLNTELIPLRRTNSSELRIYLVVGLSISKFLCLLSFLQSNEVLKFILIFTINGAFCICLPCVSNFNIHRSQLYFILILKILC